MDVSQDARWTRRTKRKVLGLKDIGQPLILYRIGNGLSMFLWFDNWHSLGPLYKRFGEEVVYDAGRSLQVRVSSIFFQGQWRWPRARNRIIRSIVAQTSDTLIPNSDVEDSVRWLPSPIGSYSIRSTWEAVRTKYLEKQWTKVVWFKRNVPRWAFILWLAFMQRLSTKGRIASWGISGELDCPCALW